METNFIYQCDRRRHTVTSGPQAGIVPPIISFSSWKAITVVLRAGTQACWVYLSGFQLHG